MPKNNMDQAPYIKNNGEKKSDILIKNGRKSWGFAMRPHELESIIFNLIDTRNVVQLKIMLFLTGNAEGYQLVQASTLERLGISKDPYYKARTALETRGWITVQEDKDKTYIVVNYDKIYQDGAELLGLKKESNCENTSDEGNSQNTPVEESTCENTFDNKKEGYVNNYTDESTFQNTSDESTCENTSLKQKKEGNCENTSEGTCEHTTEGYADNYYNSISNNINNNITSEKTQEELKAEFDAVWKNGGNSHLTGAAAMF